MDNKSDTHTNPRNSTGNDCRTKDLGVAANEIKLRCYVNGCLIILTLAAAYETFCRCVYRWVLPLGQFSSNLGGVIRGYSARKIAKPVGRRFGLKMFRSRGLVVTARQYGEEDYILHSHARYFRRLMAHVPTDNHAFENDDETGAQGYRLNRAVECILIEGPVDGVNLENIPWERFDVPLSEYDRQPKQSRNSRSTNSSKRQRSTAAKGNGKNINKNVRRLIRQLESDP